MRIPTLLTLMMFIFSSGEAKSLERKNDMEMSEMTSYLSDATQCTSDMEVWDIGMGMCMPLVMAEMPMKMVMLHGNAFGAWISEEGPRGRRDIAAPNMFMIDAGSSVGDNHYINLDFMGTVERWSFPEKGYPELLQMGEKNSHDQPFIDAQHPHSSPVMGLTLSDTIRLAHGKDHLKIYAAPRGETTDGPVAFMHRPTGMVNPDAPLGHHVGQDVGHISSSVVGASLKLSDLHFEVSAFNGKEPEPTKVDLPVGPMNSYAGRVIAEITPGTMAMASAAYVHAPEDHDADLKFVTRYSASLYNVVPLTSEWTYYNTFIYGSIHNLDHVALLSSFGEEFLFRGKGPNIWGRVEILQRTPEQLVVLSSSDGDKGMWVQAYTAGYTQVLAKIDTTELGLGGSVTKDFLPSMLREDYRGNPWTGKVFLQLSTMNMWTL